MIYLVQLLCPARHCIIAAVYDSNDADYDSVVQHMRDRMSKIGILWKCELCDSAELAFEQKPTQFKSMAQAMPIVKQVEFDQMVTRGEMLAARGRLNRN